MARGGKRPNAGRKPTADQRSAAEKRAHSNSNLKPFTPGQSGNPKGRPANAGSTLREWTNSFVEQGLTEAELRKIAKAGDVPVAKRAAAQRLLRMVEDGDLADFVAVVKGEKTIAQLRDEGVNTSLIKKIKPCEHGVEIELHDRSGEDYDRVSDRTEGRPTQRLVVEDDNDTLRKPADGEAALDAVLAGIAKRLGVAVPGRDPAA